MFEFLFWLFFVGIFIASIQDIKRREVDNWLNLLLIFSSFVFIFLYSIFSKDSNVIVFAIASLLIMFMLANLFYYGRVFAGGDAKLMFAMSALFVGTSFMSTIENIGFFIMFLLIAGSVYGIFWGIGLFISNFEKVKKRAKKNFKSVYFRYMVFAAIVLFVLSYVDFFFLYASVFLFLLVILFIFAKAIEGGAMIIEVSAKDLREGDWLSKDVKIGKSLIKSSWEGLSKKDIYILKKLNRKVKIKEGIPFVPVFFIALILYFFKDRIIEIVLGLI